jgi:MFS superfamily sulfate permease-like transporter
MRKYFEYAGADLPASIVVFLVALPLCLGIALASGAPLFSGIIGGIVGGIVIGLLSGSQLSVSGPAAGLSTIVAASLLKVPGFEHFLLAVVLCGILQVALGFVKAGIIGDYIPGSVIKGMLAAIGLLLILKQLPHIVGYDKNPEGDETFLQVDGNNTFSAIVEGINQLTPVAVLIGLVSLFFQFGWEKWVSHRKKWLKLIPSPLVVVLIGVGINEWFKSRGSRFSIDPEHMVNLPVADSANAFFQLFTAPEWSAIGNKNVWIIAVTLAIVASLETLLSIEASDNMDPYKRVTPTNRELKAQGIGNIVSGLIGGLPLTSVIVRSSANVNAGAKTKTAAIMHGLLLLVSVALIPNWLNYIPKAALAAILIYTGYKLAKPSLFKSFYKKGFNQFIPFLITIVAILGIDLLYGVLIGIGAGLFFVVRSNFKSAVFVLNDGSKYLFRFRKYVSFLNKPIIKSELEAIPNNSYLLLDISKVDFMDHDVTEVIQDFVKHAPLKNIEVEFKNNPANYTAAKLP